MQITYKGKTQTANEWTRELGFTNGTIYNRIKRGWTVEQAIETPINLEFNGKGRVKTKNDAELFLNETTAEDFPESLKPLIKGTRANKLGEFVREHHREAFNKWYEAEFK